MGESDCRDLLQAEVEYLNHGKSSFSAFLMAWFSHSSRAQLKTGEDHGFVDAAGRAEDPAGARPLGWRAWTRDPSP
ncbi:hypothetical protein AB0M95_05650 [Sphaerisporangium sp. NPDC051017]|uniref:hypothetical protein n=1 Tax=Sphaerisporangium sp. NPDC051017 TaxID=3154636 RepID=UPI003412C5F3